MVGIRRAWWTILLAGLVCAAPVLTGCQGGGSRATVAGAPPEREQQALRQRALRLLERAAQSDVDVVACHGIEALEKLAPEQSGRYFRAALQSESPLVRFAGAIAVGETRDRSAARQIARLRTDENPRVRLAAAFAAYRLGEHDAAEHLVETLNEHPDENLRSDAAYLIGRLDEPRADARLAWAARTEDSLRVQAHITLARAMLGKSAAVARLIAYTQGDLVAKVIALQGLSEVRDPKALDALLYCLNEGRRETRTVGDDDMVEVRLLAARALGYLGNDEGYGLALSATEAEDGGRDDPARSMRLRTLGALALGAIGDARALPRLKELAQDPDERVQVAACYAICEITE